MASERQVAYIHNLADKKDLKTLDKYIMAQINTEAFLEAANNTQVNIILEALKSLPWKPREVTPTPPISEEGYRQAANDMPDKVAPVDETPLNKSARYFIVDPHDGVEKFIVVSVSVQASDVLYPVKEPMHRNTILREISKDPVKAMNEYGMRLGVCGVCGRTLTKRDSRLRGMGPICAAKFGMEATNEQLDTLKRLGLYDA